MIGRHASLRLSRTLLHSPWLPWKVFVGWVLWTAAQLLLDSMSGWELMGPARIAICSVEALLALASFTLAVRGGLNDSRSIFVWFGLFFSLNGFLSPIYYLFLRSWLLDLNKFSEFYFSQYQTITYFACLLCTVLHVVISLGTQLGRGAKQFTSIMATLGICWICFTPYLVDPLHLYRQPDISDYFTISKVIQEIKETGVDNYSESEISGKVRLLKRENGKPVRTLTTVEARARIQELSPFLKNDFPETPFYRPLYDACIRVADVCLAVLVSFVLISLLRDHPKGAFLEKIAWLLLPYVILEALHYRVYEMIYRRETFDSIRVIGGYLSMVVMLLLLTLFVLRMKFVSSVEGQFYEGRVNKGAVGITRWRDMFDNWVIRQFASESDLDRRFLIRVEQGEEIESVNRQ